MKYLYFLLSLLLTASCTKTRLEADFENPPADVRVGCYWYWLDKTITKEGIVADLEAMKKAGVTRANLGITGGGDDPAFMSDGWMDLIHTALKAATRLDIEIGIFNCPGYSQSGGPWVKPSQAMRYLAVSQRHVKGPIKFSDKLPLNETNLSPDDSYGWTQSKFTGNPDEFQDFKVLAFPINTEVSKNLFALPGAKITVSNNITRNGANYKLPVKEEATVTLKLPGAKPAKGLVVSLQGRLGTDVEFQVADGKGGFTTIEKFNIDRTSDGAWRGFTPYSPVAIAFAEQNAAEYRLVFRNAGRDGEITAFTLTDAPVLERYSEKSLGKLFNSLSPPWDAFMWRDQPAGATAAINPKDVRDITEHFRDGVLTWDVPEGDWMILRTGMAPTGAKNLPAPKGGQGLEVDKMNAEYAEYHYDEYIGKILKYVPAEDRKSFRVNVSDSWEAGGQNITDGFVEMFKERYGYDPTPWFPAYYGYPVGSPELSDRFLWDMRRLVADRIAHVYMRTLREKSNADGLKMWLEPYGQWGFTGEFLQFGGEADQIGGEFWVGGMNAIGRLENSTASSAAHIYGKNVVWAESFTSGGGHYTYHPGNLKQRGDWAITTGINAFLFHVYIQQQADNVYPGVEAWYNIQFNRKNTWYSQLDLFTDYLRRCGTLLQRGVDVSDIAYFIGEDAPKQHGITQPAPPKGFHHDHINAEVLLNTASVVDGKLTLPHGTQYKVLVLPPQETMRPEVAQKILEFAEAGLPIVGAPPKRSPSMENYPAADKQVAEIAAKMSGKIRTGVSLETVFKDIKVAPDFQIVKGDAPLLFSHRRDGNADFYFVTNQSDKRVQFDAAFRVAGKQPELWDPILGEHRPLPAFSSDGVTTTVPLQLEPSGSAFVVFRKKATASGDGSLAQNFPEPKLVTEITSPWTVEFNSDAVHRGPATPVTFTTLTDWAANDNPAIKYYSGTATYKTTFKLSDASGSKNLYLDLGKVGVMAKVKLNGQYAGGVWTYPYRVNVGKLLRSGDNELEVEVVNNWANRIIGDRNLPEAERGLKIDHGPRASDPLMESGLLRPVKIVSVLYNQK